jgi:imidazolonepropionase
LEFHLQISPVTLLVHASQLLTLSGGIGGPRRGPQMRELSIVQDSAVLIADGKIVAVGTTDEVAKHELLRAKLSQVEEIDCSGKVVLPGFVDSHTHPVFTAPRLLDFEKRTAGASYEEIAGAGGGIRASLRGVRESSKEVLAAHVLSALQEMAAHGTTTVEAKSGYGLSLEAELKSLEAIGEAAHQWPGTVVPTLLGAHVVPPEYRHNPEEYVCIVCEEMIPAVAGRGTQGAQANSRSLDSRPPGPQRRRAGEEKRALARDDKDKGEEADGAAKAAPLQSDSRGAPEHAPVESQSLHRRGERSARLADFVDVFCERGAFTMEQSQRILRAAVEHGLGVRAHICQLTPAQLAPLLEFHPASLDHLDFVSNQDIAALAKLDTVATLLPAANYFLGLDKFPSARKLIDSGVAVALATDYNPGTSPTTSMPFVLSVACTHMKMLPAEAIVAATYNGACALRLQGRKGSLEPGKDADISIFEAADYRELAYWFAVNRCERVLTAGSAGINA